MAGNSTDAFASAAMSAYQAQQRMDEYQAQLQNVFNESMNRFNDYANSGRQVIGGVGQEGNAGYSQAIGQGNAEYQAQQDALNASLGKTQSDLAARVNARSNSPVSVAGGSSPPAAAAPLPGGAAAAVGGAVAPPPATGGGSMSSGPLPASSSGGGSMVGSVTASNLAPEGANAGMIGHAQQGAALAGNDLSAQIGAYKQAFGDKMAADQSAQSKYNDQWNKNFQAESTRDKGRLQSSFDLRKMALQNQLESQLLGQSSAERIANMQINAQSNNPLLGEQLRQLQLGNDYQVMQNKLLSNASNKDPLAGLTGNEKYQKWLQWRQANQKAADDYAQQNEWDWYNHRNSGFPPDG